MMKYTKNYLDNELQTIEEYIDDFIKDTTCIFKYKRNKKILEEKLKKYKTKVVFKEHLSYHKITIEIIVKRMKKEVLTKKISFYL